ncbi:MAG: UDP-glucose/GDP-mannose dehydrogenase family protein [Deltaproteobacteria bacterium]|nr:UDP-glucose/GDP-mannose dehydrogenase family protein [Deltaproteobacteria bacterium]
MKLAVVGTGYVGLVAGVGFADSGNDVICVDKDPSKIDMLLRGEIPIYEPGLDTRLARNRQEGRLVFTTDTAAAVRRSEVIFIAVGTPPGEDGSADLRHVLAVARDIAAAMDGYRVVVNKSTVPVGTAERVAAEIAGLTSQPVDVVSNPEFLKEGAAISDFMMPDRVVIGASSERARRIMGELYAPFVRTGNPILFMDNRSAEMTKYAANAMLATRISFMNEVANLCDLAGADVHKVRLGMGADPRIGNKFLFPGAGYGGSCFPKDVQALLRTATEHGLELQVLNAVHAVNEHQKGLLARKVVAHFGEDLAGLTFAMWGLAFKPNTDDMREAPSIVLVRELTARGARVAASDPVAMGVARGMLPAGVSFHENPYDALEGADALLVVTEWNRFRNPDFDRIRTALRHPVIFDGRNLYEPDRMRELGFTYFTVGRGTVRP